MAGQTTWDKNTNVFDKVLTVDNFTATTPSGSIVFSATENPSITGTIDMENVAISGNLTVAGTAYFNSIVAVTSSYSSGSTIFGDSLSDTHQFTGSVFITGSSFNWNNSRVIASNITSSMSVASASQALTASYYGGTVTSASYALTASFLQGTVTSASYALTASFLQGTASQALTASKITISNLALDTGSYFPMFANNASGPVNLFADASTYTYQPLTNILTVTASLALGVSASSINSNNSITYDTSNTNSINWDVRRLLDTAGNGVLDWAGYSVVDSNGNPSIDWENRELYDENFKLSIKYSDRREMCDAGELVSLDWGDRILVDSNGTTTLDWSTVDTVTINNALQIIPSNPLPTGSLGTLAVSGSSLYFHNGSSWQLIV